MSVFPMATLRTFTVFVGASLKIPCNGYPISYPKGSVYWAIKRTGFDPQSILYDSRVTQDQDGSTCLIFPKKLMPLQQRILISCAQHFCFCTANLWFTSVQQSDQLEAGTYYVCVLVNDMPRATTAGLDSQIIVQTSSAVSYAVSTLYNSPNFVTAIVNRSTEMKCIFGGQYALSVCVWNW